MLQLPYNCPITIIIMVIIMMMDIMIIIIMVHCSKCFFLASIPLFLVSPSSQGSFIIIKFPPTFTSSLFIIIKFPPKLMFSSQSNFQLNFSSLSSNFHQSSCFHQHVRVLSVILQWSHRSLLLQWLRHFQYGELQWKVVCTVERF